MYSKQLSFLIFFIAILLGYSCKNKENKMVEKKVYSKPNLIYILADDLGYGDLSIYGQEKFIMERLKAYKN